MTSLVQLSSKQSSSLKNILIILVVLSLVGAGAFTFGFFKGKRSCSNIDVAKAKKSLQVSQTASNNTAKFSNKQTAKIAELQQKLMEVKNACLDEAMPIDGLDPLNQ